VFLLSAFYSYLSLILSIHFSENAQKEKGGGRSGVSQKVQNNLLTTYTKKAAPNFLVKSARFECFSKTGGVFSLGGDQHRA